MNDDGLNDRERDLLEWLKASGIEMTPETRAEVLRRDRLAQEAGELFDRARVAYPIRPDTTERARRWAAKDPNVEKWDHGDGDIEYKLVFTAEQRDALLTRYRAARPNYQHYEHSSLDEASVFVGVIESWADTFDYFDDTVPDSQKERKRALDSAANALEKFDQALSALDSAALGYWYGTVVDSLATHGVQVSEADNRITSMLANPLRAMTEAGESRQELRRILGVVVEATNKAAADLPKHEHSENDWRLKNALAVERLILEHQIPFETTETGFAADALRAMFDLAGVDVEKVSYWLKKAADHPDSFARFLARMRDQA